MLLNEDLSLEDLLDGVDRDECKKARLMKLQKELDMVRTPATKTEVAKVQKVYLAIQEAPLDEPLTCSRPGCDTLHANIFGNKRGYCSDGCVKRHHAEEQRKLDECTNSGKNPAGFDAKNLDADFCNTYGLNTATGFKFLAPIRQIREAQTATQTFYEGVAHKTEGLAAVQAVSSFHESGICTKAGDVQNPEQPLPAGVLDRTDAKQVILPVFAAAQAVKPKLVALVAEVNEKAGGSGHALNIKTPLSFMRKGTENGVPCDVLRGSVAFADGAGVKRGYDLLMKRSHDEKDELEVLTLENYFAEPYNGYMDMCLQLRFGGEGAHVCELQLHLQEMMDYKYKVAHQMYTWDRRFAPAHEYTEDTYTGETNEAGERHGQGIKYYADGSKYEGQWEAGKIHGQGIYYYATGDKYEGQWEADKKHGQGIYTRQDGMVAYDGLWKDDQPVRA